jgi:hypothetical protein
MKRSIAYLSSLFGLCLVFSSAAAGQAAVEAGLGAGRAAISTAPANGIGKAISGLAGGLDKAAKSSDGSKTVTTVRMAPASTMKTPAATKWEDPGGIETGLGYAELVRRFGPPAMQITGETGTSLTYAGKAGLFQLEVRDGKVASLEKPKS